MIDDVVASLVSIESALENLGRTVLLRSLQPGLPAEAVQEALAEIGFTAPPDLELVYGWRNGTSTVGEAAGATIGDLSILPGFYFLSLEDAIADYHVCLAVDSRWEKGWLPVFANSGGDFYVVDLTSSAGSVRHFRFDEEEHPVEFSSFGAMLKTLAQAFADEVFFVDSRGYLEMDDLVFGDLAAELNPEIECWRR